MLGREKKPGKNLSDSSATPVQTGLFRARPFSDPTVSDEVSPHKQELPDLQTQLERGARFNQSLSRMKVYGNRPAIQPKISVGAPGDKYEQEADQMAQQVMSMPAAISHPPIQRLEQQEQEEKEPVQTKPLAASITPLVQRERAAAELEEEKEPVQMKRSLQRAAENGSNDGSSNLESQLSSSKGGGSPLPDEVRSFMEPRIGADFGSVRVHTGSEAVQMNRELNAQAFTHGSDVYFGEGRYNPSSSDGKRLLAHELTHVVQQTGAVQKFSKGEQRPQLEQDSDRVTDSNVDTQARTVSFGTTNSTLQRFESNEHKAMGDKGSADGKGNPSAIKLSDDLTVTFGDITAMAGDYFGSVKAIEDLAKVKGDGWNQAGTIDEIKYVLWVKVQGKKELESKFSDDVKNAVGRRYYRLAGKNKTHFTNPNEGDDKLTHDQKANARDDKGKPINNEGSYRDNHLQAIREAVIAGKTGASKDRAMLYEAFASHFLTDAYAAGHMRTPRAAISKHWNARVPMFWVNLKMWMAEQIAYHINNNNWRGVASVDLTMMGDGGGLDLWQEGSQATLVNILKEKGIPDLTFGDAISGAVHDYDNQQGVQADVGGKIAKLVGDGEVLDPKDRELLAGADTMTKAVEGVRVSLKDIEDAYAKGKAGETDAEKAIASLRLKDGIFRAEQLWPKALPDSDAGQTNKSLNWKVETVEELFNDPRMRQALAHFANEKADTLASEISLDDKFKEDAMKESVLAKLKAGPDEVVKTFRQIINYTPNTGGGLGGHNTDDNAVDYYKEVLEKKDALQTLTFEQKYKLIRDVLDGVTVGEEELMIVNLLDAKPSDAPELIKQFGWRRLWDKLDGNDCRNFVQKFGSRYWADQSYEAKRAEVKFLADGRTNDLAQETMIIILRTCSSEEVRKIDSQVGGFMGLSFDLVGKWDDEFKEMKAK